MEKICRFFIYFILFLVLYQYFNKVVEGHNVQSSSDCGSSQNRTNCRSKAPSCYWSNSDGKRTSGESGSCVSTGSTVSASRYHSGNHHASDHNHPIDPSLGQITRRTEDSGESQVNLSTSAMCDSHTCPDNYVKRDGIDNTLQGDNATQSCCRPVTCDTFESCANTHVLTTDPSPDTVNQFDPPHAPTELPAERCCTPKKCSTYTCPSTHISRENPNSDQGDDPASACCELQSCALFSCPTNQRPKEGQDAATTPQGDNPLNNCCQPKVYCPSNVCPSGYLRIASRSQDGFNAPWNDIEIRPNDDPTQRCCIEMPTCSGVTCPVGKVLKPNHETLPRCNTNRRRVSPNEPSRPYRYPTSCSVPQYCCDNAPVQTCGNYTCPSGRVKKNNVDNTPRGTNPRNTCCITQTCDNAEGEGQYYDCASHGNYRPRLRNQRINNVLVPELTEPSRSRCCRPRTTRRTGGFGGGWR